MKRLHLQYTVYIYIRILLFTCYCLYTLPTVTDNNLDNDIVVGVMDAEEIVPSLPVDIVETTPELLPVANENHICGR